MFLSRGTHITNIKRSLLGNTFLAICATLAGKHISLVKCVSHISEEHISLVIWVPLLGKHTSRVPGKGTHISSDMCSPNQETHIFSDMWSLTQEHISYMCFPGRGTHIFSDMCSERGETHFTRDMCFPGRGTHITGDMRSEREETHFTRDMCSERGETHFTRDMCFPGRGTHITSATVCVLLLLTQFW